MRFLWFLGDHIFRFRYRNPTTSQGSSLVWDVGIYEDMMEKMHFDFFFMGFVIGSIITATAAGLLWLIVP